MYVIRTILNNNNINDPINGDIHKHSLKSLTLTNEDLERQNLFLVFIIKIIYHLGIEKSKKMVKEIHNLKVLTEKINVDKYIYISLQFIKLNKIS